MFFEVDVPQRLDSFLKTRTGKSRNYLQKLIKSGNVLINGKYIVKPSYELHRNDKVVLNEPVPVTTEIMPEEQPINIIYEDKYLLIINKEAGISVHPAGGKRSGTLVNRLLYNVSGLSGIGGAIRPGIVHRLDKDTSGLMIVAKTDATHIKLSEMLKSHYIKRKYIALVKGIIKENKGTINLPIKRKPGETKMKISIQGREAITHFKVLERIGNFTLIAVQLETGRTHQIRVHFSHIGHPIIGDKLYGNKEKEIELSRHFLHSYEISFVHPIIGKEIKAFAMLPNELIETLTKLREKWKKQK